MEETKSNLTEEELREKIEAMPIDKVIAYALDPVVVWEKDAFGLTCAANRFLSIGYYALAGITFEKAFNCYMSDPSKNSQRAELKYLRSIALEKQGFLISAKEEVQRAVYLFPNEPKHKERLLELKEIIANDSRH